MKPKYKRIVAFLIDGMLMLLPAILLLLLLSAVPQQEFIYSVMAPLFVIMIIFLLPLALVARDWLFKGRSPGKRLLGLRIYDKATMQPASKRQCFFRNVFFFIYPIDGFILLTTGESLGDRVVGTAVLPPDIREQHLADCSVSNGPVSVPDKDNGSTVIKIIVISVAAIIVFAGLIQVALHGQTDSEEYQIAYNYLVSSEAFQSLNAEESRVRLNAYSSSSSYSPDTDSYKKTIEYGFLISLHTFHVTLHNENGEWAVCQECTRFQ